MSADLKHGGPAFPAKYGLDRELGMTLRDYFATKAMGLAFLRLERNYSGIFGDQWEWDEHDFDAVAEHAYAFADAMLKERNAA